MQEHTSLAHVLPMHSPGLDDLQLPSVLAGGLLSPPRRQPSWSEFDHLLMSTFRGNSGLGSPGLHPHVDKSPSVCSMPDCAKEQLMISRWSAD